MTRILMTLALAAVMAIPGAASAAPREQSFTAHMTGDAERPQVETDATGQATFHLNEDGTVSYRLIASNIDNVTAAHIHCSAPEEETAPPIVHLVTTHPGNSDGVNASGNFDPDPEPDCDDGKSPLEAMRAGEAYVNVHSSDFPGGEIRGQIEPRA